MGPGSNKRRRASLTRQLSHYYRLAEYDVHCLREHQQLVESGCWGSAAMAPSPRRLSQQLPWWDRRPRVGWEGCPRSGETKYAPLP